MTFASFKRTEESDHVLGLGFRAEMKRVQPLLHSVLTQPCTCPTQGGILMIFQDTETHDFSGKQISSLLISLEMSTVPT